LFEYNSSTNTYIKKLDLSFGYSGAEPNGSLIQASNGKVYGMTSIGGEKNLGVLFEFDATTNTFVKKIDFLGTSNGANPNGSLIQFNDGKLYGLASGGGTYNNGVLFEYNAANSTYTKKLFSFFLLYRV